MLQDLLTDDCRIQVDLNSRLAKTLSRFIPDPPNFESLMPDVPKTLQCSIKLNIVVQVAGSRGDFVLEHGLEFYPISRNPEELMAYIVKNPGLLPSMKSLKQGDIQRKQLMVAEMLTECWSSCIEPDPRSGVPFVADAKLQILQVLLTRIVLKLSEYQFISCLPCLGDVINKYRYTPGLRTCVCNQWAKSCRCFENTGHILLVSITVPKPRDWPSYIDICGFFFRNLPNYRLPPDLDAFLRAGPPLIYIGFGSIVIDSLEKVSNLLLESVQKSGDRAIISKAGANLVVQPPPLPLTSPPKHLAHSTGLLGLVTYPGQGICKSIRTAVKSKTCHMIINARYVEGQYLLAVANELQLVNHSWVLEDFDTLVKRE